MDILNWLFIKRQKLIKTKANNADTDIVALGAQVPFTTRGDGYQTYAMPLKDAVAAGCMASNTYKAGIYDVFPWIIEPSMLPTCTKIEDYPVFPTSYPFNLVGYKVGASTFVNNDNNVVEYIGTVEITNAPFPSAFMPWKTSGTVTTYADGFVSNMNSAFAAGALVRDLGNSDAYVPADYMGIYIDQFDDNMFDMYLVVGSSTALGTIVADNIAFEYEFLAVEGTEVKFIIY
jgi:hypothetical protein